MSQIEQIKQKKTEIINEILPHFTLEDLFKVGTHFGHKSSAWNPEMKHYIFGKRNGIHIIDTRKTHHALVESLSFVYRLVRSGKSVLFVSTKRGINNVVKKHATRCGQPYVHYRWLGGMLTNWKTVVMSIRKIKQFETIISQVDSKGSHSTYTKKELGVFRKSLEKLKLYFDGIRGINARPDAIIVFDVNKDSCATEEARKLCIPVIGIVDTNSKVSGIDYPIPCNDDSMNSIEFICKLFSDTIISAIKDEINSYGIETNSINKPNENKNKDIAEKIKSSTKKTLTKKTEVSTTE